MRLWVFFILFFLYGVSAINASGTTYTYTNGPWSYEYYLTDVSRTILNSEVASGGSFDSVGLASYDSSTISGSGRLFRFHSTSEEFIFQKTGYIFGGGTVDGGTKTFTGYTINEHPTGSCRINLISQTGTNTFTLSTSLEVLRAGSVEMPGAEDKIPHLLSKYYYMKTNVRAELYEVGESTPIEIILPNEATSRGSYSNFYEAKPNPYGNEVSFNFLSEESILSLHGPGEYVWKIKATPIDGKCSSIGVGPDPTPLEITLTVEPSDTDSDGINDDVDNCPTTPNPDQANFDGDSLGDACDTDIDNDGINGPLDLCPFTPLEIKSYINTSNGCVPDSDGDTVKDPLDYNGDEDCRFTPGSPAHGGCPFFGKQFCTGTYITGSTNEIFSCAGDEKYIYKDPTKTVFSDGSFEDALDDGFLTYLNGEGSNLFSSATSNSRYLCVEDDSFCIPFLGCFTGYDVKGYCDYGDRPLVTNIHPSEDADGDGILDGADRCVSAAGDVVDTIGCSQVQVDQDRDRVCDEGAPAGNAWCSGIDLCPTEGPDGRYEYQGCINEYTQINCDGDGSPSFDPSSNTFSCDLGTGLDFSLAGTEFISDTRSCTILGYHSSDISSTGVRLSFLETEVTVERGGIYQCINNNNGIYDGTTAWGCRGAFGTTDREVQGHCEIRDNKIDALVPSCTLDQTVLNLNESSIFFKDKYVRTGESCEQQIRTCTSEETLSGSNIYSHSSCEPLSNSYLGASINTTGGSLIIEEDDGTNTRKVNFDLLTNETFFKSRDGIEIPINLPPISTERKITIIKDGVNVRNDTIDPVEIALVGHKIRKYKTAQSAENFVNESVRLMKKFDITKDLEYNPIEDKTSVKIRLNNIPTTQRSNLTIYQVVDKSIAATLSDINFISDGGGQRIVLDKDPVIGWYFNESSGDEEVEYETDGETEGGTIIIVQEPILYNEGELVINYRETTCSSGEAHLFDLTDLEDSLVYLPNTEPSAIYKVCVAHLSETLYNSNSGDTDMHLFNFSNDGYSTIIGNWTSDNLVDISVNQPGGEPIYWDMKISSNNPDGTYSCLGSVTNTTNSYFGDCGYSSKKIWLHLGEDLTPPTTNVSIPFIAHSVKVELLPSDNVGGSGLDRTYYCHDDSNTCSPTTLFSGENIELTCPFDYGCIKYVRTYSVDLEGNVEDVRSYPIRLIDKGSACQADCTAKPSPNRYLKECRNLNGCSYYNLNGDGGIAVSNACDFLSEGSWVKLNVSHDVQCPKGPLRKTRFGNDKIQIEKEDCENILLSSFVTLIEGESVVMKIITCQDEE